MNNAEWFRRAHYIYTHAYSLIVVAGLFYVLGREFGKRELPREVREFFKSWRKKGRFDD